LLILHIGTHKTGTSALQTYLGNRAKDLDERGIHYLRSGRAAGKAHHELAWAIRGRKDAPMSSWDDTRAELANHRDSTTVISSEAFWFTEPQAVKDQLGETGTRVVMYLRRQDKYLQSLYKQTVAGGGRRISFGEWREKFYFRGDYLSVVRAWAEAFGKDNLVIRPYERDGRTIDVVEDFLGFLGIEMVDELERNKAGRNNPSPRRELMELYRAFNQLDVDVDRDKFFYNVIRRNEDYIRSADLLGAEECAALASEFAAGNATLAREFYTGSDPLFPDMKPVAPPEIWSPESPEYFAMQVDFLDAVWKFARIPIDGEPSRIKKLRSEPGSARKGKKDKKAKKDKAAKKGKKKME
jgi:hypothetical protein